MCFLSNLYLIWNVDKNILNLYALFAKKDLKEEVTTNGIHKLSVECWGDILSKATSLLKTRRARTFRAHVSQLDGNTHYNVEPSLTITTKHLIALLLYANFTELQTKFTETFRPLINKDTNEKESINAWKDRHSQYHHWSRYLRESVECYGHELGIL